MKNISTQLCCWMLISLLLTLGITKTEGKTLPPRVTLDITKSVFQPYEGIPLIVSLSGAPVICGPNDFDSWPQRIDPQVFRVGSGLLSLAPLVAITHKTDQTKNYTVTEVKPFRFRVNLKTFQFQDNARYWQPGTYTVRASVHLCDPHQPGQEYVVKSRNKVVFTIDE